MLNRAATIVIALVVLLTAALAVSLLVGGTRYFPSGALDSDPSSESFRSRWYSQHLEAMGEPVLYQDGRRGAIRFTWLRSFHHPIAIRVRPSDGSYQLTATELSGAGGYALGHVERREQRALSSTELARVLELVHDPGFWRPTVERSGLDGSEWIVESTEGGYRVVHQWSPSEGPVRALGIEFLRLAGWHIPPSDLY